MQGKFNVLEEFIMVKRQVSRLVLEKKPYQVWNVFIDLIAMEDYKDLTDIQRVAHLTFWYDS